MGRPKSFITCYVCFKEFGSRSITFHEPKCLEKWRVSNKNLPADKRTSTPVKSPGRKNSQENIWVCSHCQGSFLIEEKDNHLSLCYSKNLKPKNTGAITTDVDMTGVIKSDFSPKKGKENKNISNHIPIPSVGRRTAKYEAKKDKVDTTVLDTSKDTKGQAGDKVCEDIQKDLEDISATSKRSVRPQTKILRRPTPNLKHPVIQLDSDDSSGDSSCSSDKSKDDNPKRLKMGNESSESTHKSKNFILYNKYNVEKNTKNVPKERTSATISLSIPNPCNSCNRSQAPERLHSHAKRDARGLMYRKSPSLDIKMSSPQKKMVETSDNVKVDIKDTKSTQLQESIKIPKIPVIQKSVKDSSKNILDETILKSVSKSLEELANQETKEEFTVSLKKELVAIHLDESRESQSTVRELEDIVKSCYICQEEFKISELLLHESKCLESWKKTNNSLTPNLRKLPPRRPDEEDVLSPDEADPAWSSVQSQLVPCPVCARTFFPERLPVHRRVCKGKASPRPLKRAASLREQSASSTDGEDQKPAAMYVPCYVCGRNYGSWVISMHEQQCLRKWRRENDKLPDDEQKEEPRRSPLVSPDDEVASLIELGDNAWQSHLQQLVPCPLCSRTFFPDRLGVHKRSCKGPNNGRRPKSNKGA